MSENIGWECPRCHKINAPHVNQCDCVKQKVEVNKNGTVIVHWPWPAFWETPIYEQYKVGDVFPNPWKIIC